MSMPASTLQQDRRSFPAMELGEIPVWKAWLQLHEAEYTRVEYNVRVGPGFDPGPGTMDYIRQMAIKNTKKRIDAVAWQGDQPLIVEVKVRAGLSSIGQILGYRTHWKIEHPHSVPPKMLLVAHQLAPGVEEVLREHNVPWELV